jgi:hypothetical protein
MWAQFSLNASHILGHCSDVAPGNIQIKDQRGRDEVMPGLAYGRTVNVGYRFLFQGYPPSC